MKAAETVKMDWDLPMGKLTIDTSKFHEDYVPSIEINSKGDKDCQNSESRQPNGWAARMDFCPKNAYPQPSPVQRHIYWSRPFTWIATGKAEIRTMINQYRVRAPLARPHHLHAEHHNDHPKHEVIEPHQIAVYTK